MGSLDVSGALPALSASSAAAIATELREAIVAGVYAKGQRLPPERTLATHYNASRSTVREALRQLTEQQLVQRRIGSGTFVTYREAVEQFDIAETTSPLQLIEVRMAIEPHIARLAVLHATGRDIDRIVGCMEDLRAAEKDPQRYAEADERFHLALAQSTANPLLIWLYRQINEIRLQAQWGEMRAKVLDVRNMRIYNEQHEAVTDAVRRRDANAAAAAMREQMEKARNDLLGARSR
ncbi:MAG: FCD domain-containing protein [Geminicoccaceae bacterium]